jgi:hypothetical protein
MNSEAVDTVCVSKIAEECAVQRPDARGRFTSKCKEALGVVDDGQLTRAVTAYISPKGCGYAITFHFRQEGRSWRRVVNTGPEDHRETPWFEEVKPKIR